MLRIVARLRRRTGAPVLAVGLLAAVGFWRLAPGHSSARVFQDATARAGLAFQYDNDAAGAYRFIETTGGGCGFLDYDNDGHLDLFAVQGGPAPGSAAARPRPLCALYRNRGDGTFQNVTRLAGLEVDLGYAQGVSAADYDNDGWRDLLISTYGGVRLFRNLKGRFTDVTRRLGLAQPGEPHWATSTAWADYDRDGWLDLFVCHYASWFPDVEEPCFETSGERMYCSPQQYPGDVSVLYRNEGPRGFRDVTASAGLGRLEGKALGAVWTDYDGDGRPDLFVANDMLPNWLLRNRGDGTFAERAARAGVATGPDGLPLSGMGVAPADFNGDGHEDLFVTNFSLQPRSYFLNSADGYYRWGAGTGVVGDARQPFLAFPVEQLDYDLDGDPDLVIGNGHLNPGVDRRREGVTYRQRQQLLRNRGDGHFEEDRGAAGDLDRPRVTRGLAVGDYDNDGRPDCLISGLHDPLALFRNSLRSGARWIGFRVEGTISCRDGLGARVTVHTPGRSQVRTARSGSSYCSASDVRLLFGLGTSASADVEIRWPSGRRHTFPAESAGRYYLLREDGTCRPDPRHAAREPEGR
jgi:hypothetical protein